MKKCLRCENNKEDLMFSKNKKSKDGLQSRCKVCDSEVTKMFREKNPKYMNKYFQDHKNQYLALHQKWNNNNREYLNLWQKEYRKLNLKKIQDYQNTWVTYKYNNDFDYKLKMIVRNRVLKGLKGKYKQNESIKYLGCSPNEYKQYLELLFKPEMNWENYGVIWEIDHIIAISNFDLKVEDNIISAFNYKNTQPLFKTTKISKMFGYTDEIGNRNKSNK